MLNYVQSAKQKGGDTVYKIKEFREEQNMSQEELARRSGVSRTIVSGLENNTITVTTTKTLLAIANALGKNVNDIFFADSV